MTTKSFRDAEKALQWVKSIYDSNVEYLRYAFQAFSKGEWHEGKAHAYYPFLEITTKKVPVVDNRLSFGFLSHPGVYRTTLTRPDLFHAYYIEQFSLLLKNHPESELRIGVSNVPIPLHFALGEHFHLEGDLTAEQITALPEIFDQPNLVALDDTIPSGTHIPKEGEPKPLALFVAPRVDLSLQRLKHYTGTTADHFQKFVMFTNYPFYVDEFIRFGHELMEASDDKETSK